MSLEKLQSTLNELISSLEQIDDPKQQNRLAVQVQRVVDPILRMAKGQRGSINFPPKNKPSSPQPGSSGGSAQPTLTPQSAVTQTTGTIHCPQCNQILDIDVTLS